MIAALIYAVVMVYFAIYESKGDYDTIRSGEGVDHPAVFSWRVFVAVVAAVVTCWIAGLGTAHGFLLLLVAVGAFGITFRHNLNHMRGLDWWYVSPSNEYDKFWIRSTGSVQQAGMAATITEAAIGITGLAAFL